MAAEVNAWRTESNPSQQTVSAIIAVCIGLALALGFRHFEGPGLTANLAGFLLGLLIFSLALGCCFSVAGRLLPCSRHQEKFLSKLMDAFERAEKKLPSVRFRTFASASLAIRKAVVLGTM